MIRRIQSMLVILAVLCSLQHDVTAAESNIHSDAVLRTASAGSPILETASSRLQQRELKNKNKNNYNNYNNGNNNADGGDDKDNNSEDNEQEDEDDYYVYSQMNGYNTQSDASKKVAITFMVFLAVFAGVAIGIVAAANGRWESARCKILVLRQRQQERKAATRAQTLKQNLTSGDTDCGSVIARQDTIVTSFSEQETGQEGIGTPAIVQMTSLKTAGSADFGGGYVAPQEHTRVNILYNA